MAEQQQPSAASAAFPAPPPFYKYFTDQNLERFEELQDEQQTKGVEPVDVQAERSQTPALQPSSPHAVLDLPPELRYLIPPPPPPTGQYRSFGEEHNISAPLPSLPPKTPQLYHAPPDPPTLLRMTRSLLLNFLEMVHILAVNPSDYPAKWDDLRDLLRNAHQMVNAYRPHQARESLILMMEEQVERCREEIRGVREMKRKVEGILEGLAGEGEEVGGGGNGSWEEGGGEGEVERRRKLDEERRVWEVVAQYVG